MTRLAMILVLAACGSHDCPDMAGQLPWVITPIAGPGCTDASGLTGGWAAAVSAMGLSDSWWCDDVRACPFGASGAVDGGHWRWVWTPVATGAGVGEGACSSGVLYAHVDVYSANDGRACQYDDGQARCTGQLVCSYAVEVGR